MKKNKPKSNCRNYSLTFATTSISIAILLLLLCSLAYFGYNAIQKRTKIAVSEKKSEHLSTISFYKLDETVFTYHNQNKVATVLVYFHPECEHCQYEAKQLLLNKEVFSKTQIIMISPAPLTQIKEFNTKYELNKIESLQVLWDKDRAFETYFGTSTFPTVLIYNTENQLQKKYKGEVKIEAILKHLEKVPKEKISEVSSKSNSEIYFFDFNIMVWLFDLGL